ncbi:anti-sigma factor domain-containing protein [uncultured Friedmanniella sp.]|uniref:anti-sigma factor n=1 Tax=uncultured Friedmanniella sp. TaxID=335381 RepID=UPI0035CA8495
MHTDPDLLALLALGERVGSPLEHAHLAECSECRAELGSLRAVTDLGRRTTEGDALTSPPPHVWQRIRQELQLDGGASGPPDAPGADVVPVGPTPVPPNRRGVRAAALVLAAALALVVGIGIGANLDQLSPAESTVSSIQLNALPPYAGSSGRAWVERDRKGSQTLVVQISSPEPATGPREVWLTDSLAEPMVAMGYLDGNAGRFPIPPGMQLARNPLVDVSQEPAGDKDPAHSGHSMLRGKLPV